MSEIQFSYTHVDYLALMRDMFQAGHQAVNEYMDRNPVDSGTCGWAVVVIDDAKAADKLHTDGPFTKASDGSTSFRVSCGNYQSMVAASYVAHAMAEALIYNGVRCHVDVWAD